MQLRALSLESILDESPFGLPGLLSAVVFIGLMWLLLSKRERSLATMPIVLFAIHVGLLFWMALLPKWVPLHKNLHLVALAALLLAIGRAGFIALVHSTLSNRLTRPLPRILRDLLQAGVYALVIVITLREAGVAPGSIFATSAVLTAVIGLSLQDTLGNLFAGLAIQLQRPFDVGDWIQFDSDPKHVGRVMEINWRATKVLSQDQVEVTVPNGTLAKAPISNFTKPSVISRRTVSVTAPYDVQPKRVEELLLSIVREIPGALKEPAPTVILSEFGDRGLEYRIRFCTDDFRNREHIDSVIRERIWYGFQRNGIRMPVPSRDIYSHEVSEQSKAKTHQLQISEREEALGRVDFLGALPQSVRRRLAELSETRLYGAGEVILRQGDHGEELFVIHGGEVAVLLNQGMRGDVEITRLGPGNFVGEMSLMTGEQRSATVVATRPCEVIVLGKAAFKNILVEKPELAAKISDVLASRMQELGEKAVAENAPVVADRKDPSGILLAKIRAFFSL